MLTRAKKARLELIPVSGKLTEETRKPVNEKPFSDNEQFNQHQIRSTKERKRNPKVRNDWHREASCLSNRHGQ